MWVAYLVIFANTLVQGFSTIFRKNYVNDNINVKNSLNIYLLLSHPIAAVYFLLMAGGKVPLNIPSFWFSFVYAWICMASVLFTMLAYDKINLVYISVFSGAGAMIVPFVYDLLVGIEFSVYKYIAVILRLAAVLIPLIFNRSKNRGLIICVILFFVSGFAGIIPKLYGQWEGVVSDESFCFWTNIVIMPIVGVLIFTQNRPGEIVGDIKKIRPSGYIYILLATAISNIGTLLSIGIMRVVSPTVYSILTSSLGMVITALISVFIYKEELSKQ